MKTRPRSKHTTKKHSSAATAANSRQLATIQVPCVIAPSWPASVDAASVEIGPVRTALAINEAKTLQRHNSTQYTALRRTLHTVVIQSRKPAHAPRCCFVIFFVSVVVFFVFVVCLFYLFHVCVWWCVSMSCFELLPGTRYQVPCFSELCDR